MTIQKLFSSCPPNLKAIQHYLKIAVEHEKRDHVITYWCTFYALQLAMKIDRNSDDCKLFLGDCITWLENEKTSLKEEEAVTNEVVAQAHIETYALKLFLWADAEDRSERFNKNVVKAFYTSGILFDVLITFGELTDEVAHHRKYAKWKAAYIHNCLKSGEKPVPGPLNEDGDEEESVGVDPPTIFNQSPNSAFPQDVIPKVAPYPNNTNLYPPTPGVHAPPSTPSERPSPPSETVAQPSSSISSSSAGTTPSSSNQVNLSVSQFMKAQKYCKWAQCAIQYEDVTTAVDNLQKAIKLLTTGIDS